MVAYNMSGWRSVVSTIKRAPKSDSSVLIITFVLTVLFDLVVAIVVGLALACLLFMKRMSDVTDIRGWEYKNDVEKIIHDNEEYHETSDTDHISLKDVPENTLVFEITGPLFFGAADKLSEVVRETKEDILILRMRSVPAMDETAMHTLDSVYDVCQKNNIELVFSHVNEQPMSVLVRHGYVEKLGEDHFCKNIDKALEFAASIQERKK